jgi:hypothetical protein
VIAPGVAGVVFTTIAWLDAALVQLPVVAVTVRLPDVADEEKVTVGLAVVPLVIVAPVPLYAHV